ncbi:hypothetical protein PsYK624_112750 [Phanerochaete sordida]|uniref:Uncharacterized protein n=1 Tax=Phanerochaete sordida TaxID=48140 RepID=A0A9P3LH96_9APHY|nr:hypothetical protein PsYK624_112750 [Phanerochaete sordida]
MPQPSGAAISSSYHTLAKGSPGSDGVERSDNGAAPLGPLSPLDRLSQELVDAIVDELREDEKSLKVCTLTYRRWFSRSSAHLLSSCMVINMPSLAMEPPKRVQSHLVKLTIEPRVVQHFELLTALPRLSELVVSGHHLDLATFDSRSAILRTSTERAIDSITVKHTRLEVVELLVRLFVDVQTLRWEWCFEMPQGNPKFLDPPLAVRNLEVINSPGPFLPYIAHIMDRATVESLKVQLICHIGGGPGAFLDDFIQWFPHLHTYHHVDPSGMPTRIHADLPTLLNSTSISSVAITTEALKSGSDPERFQRNLAWLAALPVGTRRVALVYEDSWRTAEELTEHVRKVDWEAASRAVERYAKLEILEVSVQNTKNFKRGRGAPSLVEVSEAREVVAKSLPKHLRTRLVFK